MIEGSETLPSIRKRNVKRKDAGFLRFKRSLKLREA